MNAARQPIRVLIVEDTEAVRLLLEHIIERDPRLAVAASVTTGEEALRIIDEVRPDVVSMDIRLPGMNGFQATREIMARRPTPIVVVSASVEAEDLLISMNALKAGALAVVEKPVGISNADYEKLASQLCRQLILMSDVKVIRQHGAKKRPAAPPPPRPRSAPPPDGGYRLLGLVASTGGPNALVEILRELGPVELPIVLVQHITPSFLGGFVSWLATAVGIETQIVERDSALAPGVIHVAPAERHLEVCGDRVRPAGGPKVLGQRPSGTVLFRSMAETAAPHSIGVLLTGMGEDGADGLLQLRRAGGHTIAEDESTAVVYGMPRTAALIGAVDEQLPLHRIAPRLRQLCQSVRMVP